MCVRLIRGNIAEHIFKKNSQLICLKYQQRHYLMDNRCWWALDFVCSALPHDNVCFLG